MKNAVTFLHLGDQWQRINAAGTTLSPAQPYPNIDQPAWVIESFANAPVGVMRLQGKAAHAPALIERKVRSEGLVDSESHILIHRQLKEANGLQVLYTAIPLDTWQQVMGWAASQKDHCLVLPLATLLCAEVHQGEGRVLRLGRQLICFAHHDAGFVHAMVTAYSEAMDDLLIATSALADQISVAASANAQPLRLTWCPLLAHQAEEQQLLDSLSQKANCTVELAPMARLQIDAGRAAAADADEYEADTFATSAKAYSNTGQNFSGLRYLLQQRQLLRL